MNTGGRGNWIPATECAKQIEHGGCDHRDGRFGRRPQDGGGPAPQNGAERTSKKQFKETSMTGRILKILVPLALLALIVTAWAAEAPQVMEARRLAEQARTYRVSAYPSVHSLPVADGPQDRMNSWQSAQAFDRAERSIIQDNYALHTGLSVMGPTEPGIKIASTTYDFQHNDACPHQIAENGSGSPIHFTWTHWDVVPESLNQVDRFVNFNTYNSATSAFLFGVNGVTLSDGGGNPKQARGGFTSLDIDDNNRAHVAFHARAAVDQPSGDYSSWELDQSSPLFSVFTSTALFQSTGPTNPNGDDDRIWPHVTVDQQTGSDIYYVLAHSYASNDNIYFWRWKSTDSPQWKGPYPVDSGANSLSYNIAADKTSNKVALVCTNADVTVTNPLGIYQITYREELNNGNTWGPVDLTGLGDAKRVFITSYNDSKGPGAWLEEVGDYDNSGNLHVVWNEQRFNSGGAQGSWKHWDKSSNAISTIALAYYDNVGGGGGRDINIAYPTLGFGDGSTTCGGSPNLNYLYMCFVQFGGVSVAEQNDMSSKQYMNGEVYISESNNGGALWSPAINLTNSLKPGCDPGAADSCPSENFPSIARVIDDTIHILYIADRDAGDAVFGQGVWTYNPVMYYRIPGGTNVQPVCPLIAPNFGAELADSNGAECEYNTPPSTSISMDFRLTNVGNAAMTGTISKTGGTWLNVTGLGSYTIPAGGAAITNTVTMTAPATQGLLTGSISISHNDPTKGSPFVIPIDFFVFTNFACPKYIVLHTKWLELEVSNIERVGMGPDRSSAKLRGLYWPTYSMRGAGPTADSGFNSVYDASLMIGRAPYDVSNPPDGIPDTVVYRYVFGQGNFAKGFRALSALVLDTNAYGSGAGVATVRANQTTVDSLFGVDVKYEAPQSDDSSNFVLIKYKIFNRTANTYSGMFFGECADFDVLPSTANAGRQSGSQNKAGFNIPMNLIYQHGIDSSATSLNLAEKYYGGMTAIQNTASPRTWSAPNSPWLFGRPGGGFHEGYLYSQMMKTNFEVIAPVPAPTGGGWVDMHSVTGFEKGVTMTPTTVKHYVVGFVSSRGGPGDGDIIAQTKKAWKFAFGWEDFVSLDTVPASTPSSYPYYAIGSHENGPTGGCSGCVITKTVDASSKFSFTPDTDPCTGTIGFAGNAAAGTFTATFQLATPGTCSPVYTETRTITVVVVGGPSCSCPHQGDMQLPNGSGAIDVSDVLAIIKVAFVNGTDVQDPQCPKTRADVNNSGVVDVSDVLYIIKTAFVNGPNPVQPCP